MKKPSTSNHFERRLLEDAGKVIGEINGEPIDNLERVWRLLKTNMDRPEIAKLVLQHYEAAMASEHV